MEDRVSALQDEIFIRTPLKARSEADRVALHHLNARLAQACAELRDVIARHNTCRPPG